MPFEKLSQRPLPTHALLTSDRTSKLSRSAFERTLETEVHRQEDVKQKYWNKREKSSLGGACLPDLAHVSILAYLEAIAEIVFVRSIAITAGSLEIGPSCQ